MVETDRAATVCTGSQKLHRRRRGKKKTKFSKKRHAKESEEIKGGDKRKVSFFLMSNVVIDFFIWTIVYLKVA